MFCDKCGKKFKSLNLYCKKCRNEINLVGGNFFGSEEFIEEYERSKGKGISTGTSSKKYWIIPVVIASILVTVGVIVATILLICGGDSPKVYDREVPPESTESTKQEALDLEDFSIFSGDVDNSKEESHESDTTFNTQENNQQNSKPEKTEVVENGDDDNVVDDDFDDDDDVEGLVEEKDETVEKDEEQNDSKTESEYRGQQSNTQKDSSGDFPKTQPPAPKVNDVTLNNPTTTTESTENGTATTVNP